MTNVEPRAISPATSEPCDEPCPIERGMRVLGGRWTASVLWHLQDEAVRFNDLARMIPAASRKMLSQRLRHLEEHGLVRRIPLDTRPPGVAYAIEPPGTEALSALDELRKWVEQDGR